MYYGVGIDRWRLLTPIKGPERRRRKGVEGGRGGENGEKGGRKGREKINDLFTHLPTSKAARRKTVFVQTNELNAIYRWSEALPLSILTQSTKNAQKIHIMYGN